MSRESVHSSAQAVSRLHTWPGSPYTHFLSLPLPAFRSSLDALRSSILSEHATAPGLDPSVFVRPASLHFTVLMLSLPTARLVQRAADALASVAAPMSDGLAVRLRGLAVMNDRPEAAHVLYMQPDEPSQQRLAELAGRLITALRQANVLSESEVRRRRLLQRDGSDAEEKADIKWHATVINTKHRRREHSARSDGRQRLPVDVSSVLAQYGDADWGEGVIHACELSRLSSPDPSTDYYPCDGRLML